ncbi:hypothetical protein GQ53DRAFT_381307 [Thozetella sp. PMI_491]|nr:hypothetical protein GQ53DRAFT_381307 [Thozetella sp. PMI_491]
MVKADMNKDYYADLELPPTADIADIKKQYRKLALKWHPDRNVGREEEVRARFVVIHEAMEVLTDPVQKQKYDTNRKRTSRYPGASGVKGNPWQDVSSKFQPPPRRTAREPRPAPTASGASRYSNWAPPPNRSPRENPTDHAKAWERMRPSSSGGRPAADSRQQSPRHPTRNTESQSMPKTASQKQRAEASFGSSTRRTGFVPASPMGDERPVSNSNYFTTKTHTSIFDVASAAAAAAKKNAQASQPAQGSDPTDPISEQFSDNFFDQRQSTPYANHVGEKTRVFDSVNLNRARTVRDAFRRAQQNHAHGASMPQRQRSVSVGGDSSPKPQADDDHGNRGSSGNTHLHPDSAASGTAQRRESEARSVPASSPFVDPHSSSSTVNSTKANAGAHSASAGQNGPSVYASSPCIRSFRQRSGSFRPGSPPATPLGSPGVTDPGFDEKVALSPEEISFLFSQPLESPQHVPSGEHRGDREQLCLHEKATSHKPPTVLEKHHLPKQAEVPTAPRLPQQARPPELPRTPNGLNAFKREIQMTLERLISGSGRGEPRPAFPKDDVFTSPHISAKSCVRANFGHLDSFSFNLQEDTFEETSRNKPNPFMRNSADNINTRFAADENAARYQFNAGGPPGEDESQSPKRRFRDGANRGRQSPPKAEADSSRPFTDAQGSPQRQDSFDADAWAAKFGPEHFVPPPPGRSSASPTRRTTRKPKGVKLTAGTAGLVDEEETSSEEKTRPSSAANIDSAASPMDIDDPPQASSPQPSSTARNIPVEPSRKEWRAGDANGSNPAAPRDGAANGVNPGTAFKGNAAGSEDSEEFLRSDIFANTEPFMKTQPGLSSFGDMKSSLPFESKPSARIPIRQAEAKPIYFPPVPRSPNPPAAFAISNLKPSAPAWAKYVREFNAYLIEWSTFNARFTDHFAARRRKVEETQKQGGFDWLGTQGDLGIDQYIRWLEEDKQVRQKWTAACDAHELSIREFQKHRQRMKQ